MVEVSKVLWNNLVEALKILGADWTARSTRYFGMKLTTFDGGFLTSGFLSSGPPRRLGALSDWCFPRLPSRRRASGYTQGECQSVNRPENETKTKSKKPKSRKVVGRECPAKKEDKTEVKAVEGSSIINFVGAVSNARVIGTTECHLGFRDAQGPRRDGSTVTSQPKYDLHRAVLISVHSTT